MLALVLGLVLQGPQVSAAVDRSTVLIGELVTLTIRVEAAGGDPVRIGDPVLTGFEVRGSRDVTQVRMVAGAPRRIVTRELRLLATSAGRASIGPVRVTHGGAIAETAPIVVTVAVPAPASAAGVAPRVRALLDTLRAPVGGPDVVVEVLAVPDTVRLGDQLDLVTLAWFPRDVRLQLRSPPTLAPPDVQGVWSYQQTTSPGVVTSRMSGGRWYDLYVSHQVVFPLTTGRIRIGRATVTYVQPLSYSFLSRELQHEVQSESLAVGVRAQPVAGRPPEFSGAAGERLTVALEASQTTLPPGGAATVTATLTGVGNVSLWPEPRIAWPAGVRVYPGEVSVAIEPRDGVIAGTKRFAYLVVADSAGTHAVPGLSYPYFDPARDRYAYATAPGLQLVAPPGAMASAPRPLPPPLQTRTPGRLAWIEQLAAWVWLTLWAAPPLLVMVLALMRRVRLRLPSPGVRIPDRGPLEALDQALRGALEQLVGGASHAEGPALAAALRAAGVDPSLASHAVRVRERLRHAVFGPDGASDPEELSAEVHEVLRALAGETAGTTRSQLLPLAVAFGLVTGVGTLGAQAPRPEQLYEAGAFRTAADSFATRVAREPQIPAYWYNLGAAYYRLGEDGRAHAAWLRGSRLAPRDPTLRRALALLPPDALSRRIVPVAWATPAELLVVATGVWVLGWILLATRRARLIAWSAVVLAATGAAGSWHLRRAYRAPVAIVLRDDVPLRAAPFGSAEGARTLFTGNAVRVLRAEGVWLLVDRGGAQGWVLPGEVARL